MKKLIILLSFSILFAFKVEFIKIDKEFIVPKTDAVLIKTKDDSLTFPFKFIKTKDGYILYGNITQINYYLENNFYAPMDATFKNIKIAIVDKDKLQYQIIKKIKKTYRQCKIEKIIFLDPDETLVITKPTTITHKYKVILNCK